MQGGFFNIYFEGSLEMPQLFMTPQLLLFQQCLLN